MKLTTTLQKIRDAQACTAGYRKLANHLGGCETYGMDTPIDLLTILESNGVQDMLWCLRCTVEDSKRISVELAIAFASEVLPIYEAKYPGDDRPRNAVEASRRFIAGEISEDELNAAADAAWAARSAWSAADAAGAAADAAGAARSAADVAWAAERSAAARSAWAAVDAAGAAARDQMLLRQAEIIRKVMA